MLQWFHAGRLAVAGLPASRLRVLVHLKAALMGIELTAILGRVLGSVKFGNVVVFPSRIVYTELSVP
jgi:hypothetical protein